MSKLFGEGLTVPNSAVAYPGGGMSLAGPQGALDIGNKAIQSAGAPTDLSINNGVPTVTANPNLSLLPRITQPSFKQASSDSAGNVTEVNKTETPLGKLLHVLRGGVQGGSDAIAGGALDAPRQGQSPFGTGFGASTQLPMLRRQQAMQAQQQAFQLKEMQDQAQEHASMFPLQRLQLLSGLQKSQADTAKTNAEIAGMPAKQALEQAQAEAAFYKEDPNLGLVDIRNPTQPLSKAGLVPLTAGQAQVLGKKEGDLVPLKLKNTADEIVNRGFSTINTEEGVFERNRGTGKMTRLGSNPRMVFAPENRIVPVAADPNNPGNVTFMRAGDAMNQGVQSPQSAPSVTAKATAKAIAPGGKVGDEIRAFNTAIQHADLLKNAANALHNGKNQTLNGLQNSFKNEFGLAGPITSQAIADAYTREISKMLTGGHLTDSEIGSVGKTIDPRKQSIDQMLGVLGAYQALAKSKMAVTQHAVEQGQAGKADFPAQAPADATHVVPGPDGRNHYTNATGTVDLGVAP